MRIRGGIRVRTPIAVTMSALLLIVAMAASAAGQNPAPAPVRGGRGSIAGVRDGRENVLYNQGRAAIEQNRYERAVEAFDRVIVMQSRLADAATYWKAYSLWKLTRLADALTTVSELQKQFPDSRWLKDARALEVEIRQASGQPVGADLQNDEELKLLALRGLMQSNPESALPIIEKMLAGTDTPRVKERALFVLSQSGSPRARDIIVAV